MTNLLTSSIETLKVGGWPMVPLILATFAIWFLYFMSLQQQQVDSLRQNIKLLAALVVAAPLIGLLGTVLGMMETFQGVAAQNSETASQIAGGISQALVTTQAGLVAAIPGTFALVHLNAKIKKLKSREVL